MHRRRSRGRTWRRRHHRWSAVRRSWCGTFLESGAVLGRNPLEQLVMQTLIADCVSSVMLL
ncbi:hypothetical protein GO592_21815 [Rhodococcus sp. 21391]|nr:hypothetical protein GO592_21815 [Rhodococcus sp. 21391]